MSGLIWSSYFPQGSGAHSSPVKALSQGNIVPVKPCYFAFFSAPYLNLYLFVKNIIFK